MKKLYQKKKILNSIGATALASVMLTSCATATAETTEPNTNVVVQTMDVNYSQQEIDTLGDICTPLFKYKNKRNITDFMPAVYTFVIPPVYLSGVSFVYADPNPQKDVCNLAPERSSWTNEETGQKFIAFGLEPAYCAASTDQRAKVDVMPITNEFVDMHFREATPAFLAGIATYGYPTVDAETLIGKPAEYYDVDQMIMNYAAYYATIVALWSGDGRYDINSWKILFDEDDYHVWYPKELLKDALKASKKLYKKASEYQPPEETSKVSFTAGEPKQVGNNYEVVFTVENPDKESLGSELLVKMREFRAYAAQRRNGLLFPEGLQICDMAGKEYTKVTSDNGDEQYVLPAETSQFKVIVPDPGKAGIQVDLQLLTEAKKPVLLYGSRTYIGQDFLLVGDMYENLTAGFAINKNYETYSELRTKEWEKYVNGRGEVTITKELKS